MVPKKHFLTALISLAIVPMTIALSGCKNTTESQDKTFKKHDHSAHNHGPIEVSSLSPNGPIPKLDFSIEKDPMTGWNIQIQTENFVFAPHKVNQDASANEGHAHIFVDGFKMARVYGEWFHLKRLTPGDHTVTITLNANDHSEWSHEGNAISISKTITQP